MGKGDEVKFSSSATTSKLAKNFANTSNAEIYEIKLEVLYTEVGKFYIIEDVREV